MATAICSATPTTKLDVSEFVEVRSETEARQQGCLLLPERLQGALGLCIELPDVFPIPRHHLLAIPMPDRHSRRIKIWLLIIISRQQQQQKRRGHPPFLPTRNMHPHL